ncbi:MAG: hypothetical protein ACE5DU_08575, partial [Nitrosopumilus sp.]
MKTTQLLIFAALSVALLSGIMPGEDATAAEPIDFDVKSKLDSDSSNVIPQIMQSDQKDDETDDEDEKDDETDD